MTSVDPERLRYQETRDLPRAEVLELYRKNEWSAADRPDELCSALANSHAVASAWDGAKLVGLGNAISDGALVVYYPHLLVLPEYRRLGIGRRLMRMLQTKYAGFHQQILVADGAAMEFYQECGFEPAGRTRSMWIYRGEEH